MNNSKKVFMVLVLTGMFLLPPAAASDTGGAGDAAADASYRSPVGSPRPSGLVRPMERTADTPGEAALASAALDNGAYRPLVAGYSGGARGPRAGPDVYPYQYAVVTPSQIRMWRGSFIVAVKGADTQWNITVNNSGDAAATPATVTVIFTDLFDKEMARFAQTGDIAATSNATFYFQFRPAYCSWFVINITATAAGDTDTTNDAAEVGYFGTALWGDECLATTGWNGDISSTKWHITDSPENDNASQHTAPNAWYAGRDALVGSDSYDPNMDVSVKTLNLDLRGFGKQYYLMFDYLFHGQLPVLDAGDYFENSISTDGGATWSDPIVHVDGPWIGPTSMLLFRDNWLHWVTPVQGGSIPGLDLSDYAGKLIQIRNHFVSNAANQDWGLYFDDFALWGVEIFNDTRIDMPTDVADMKINEK